nr:hypothetical protein [Mycobacterium sp. UM_NZ2]
MTTKSLNKHFIARVLDRAALSGNLAPELAQQCVDLIAEIDAGKGGIPAKTEALINRAWAAQARVAAAAEKPAQQRVALQGLRSVAALESALGLAPAAEPAPEPEAEPVTEPVTEPTPEPAGSYSFGGAA